MLKEPRSRLDRDSSCQASSCCLPNSTTSGLEPWKVVQMYKEATTTYLVYHGPWPAKGQVGQIGTLANC